MKEYDLEIEAFQKKCLLIQSSINRNTSSLN